MFAAMIPPTIAQAQQQMFGMLMKGIADRSPRITPPIRAGFSLSFMSVYTFTGGDRKTFRSELKVSPALARPARPRRRRYSAANELGEGPPPSAFARKAGAEELPQ